ncbi:MAG: double-strand break repair protein AddB [Hyphomicrobiales bacterium]|nr:double-strand break repair protein AddB [Hyphomicrobiales bacterium]
MPILRVLTIPASAPFMPTLIGALIGGKLAPAYKLCEDPLALARTTIYLPTRRACRLARDLFLDVIGQSAAILPRIVALGDVDEDEIIFAQAATGALAGEALDLPPALGGLERRMLLARLVQQWAAAIGPAAGEPPLVANTPASALALADDLARLIDDMTTRGVSWDLLDQLVPEEVDRYWQLTLEFLKVARAAWPQILAERGAIEPAARRDALLAAEAKRLAIQQDGPVIVAGSTGSMPATAELIATVAGLPHGAVVLPGLDTDLDNAAWDLIGGGEGETRAAVSHPQFAMQALLRRLGMLREEVEVLGRPTAHGRERLVSEALRPAAATERWRDLAESGFSERLGPAIETLAVVEAANPEEEALAIAVALRETLATTSGTAALVTPDRALARRVTAALARWGVEIEDSAGTALAVAPAGQFARLAAEAVLGGLPPVSLLALLKHPLLRLGAAAGAWSRAVAALELAVLRGPRPQAGSTGLAQALQSFRAELARLRTGERSDLHPSDPRTRVSEHELADAAQLVATFTNAILPLEIMRGSGAHPPASEFAERHRDVLAALSRDRDGAPAAFCGHDGVQLQEALDDLVRAGALPVSGKDYAELFDTAVAERVVRSDAGVGARIRIYGLLEARLQSVDRVVLGSLVEGTWPPEARSDPWLSRPMRQALGLDLPERRISLSAHDFAQALGAREVILTYPTKLAGAPTVTSRFVQRLAAVVGTSRWEGVRRAGERYRTWARALDAPSEIRRWPKPEPRPPRAARPTSMSVTDIESWLRDPYTIYAKHILKLRELDPIDLPPGAADRGIIVHGALSEFTSSYASGLPPDPMGALLEIGRRHFAPLDDYPEARAFWWPRFQRIARWFAGWEMARRCDIAQLLAEVSGKIEIPAGERVFTLRCRADRIERWSDGRFSVLDYKTGQVPTDKQVRIGVSPQLTLEAAMLHHGGFDSIPAGASVAELVYVSLRGGERGGESKPVEFKDGDAGGHAARALSKLAALIGRFEEESQPYLPLVLSMWKSRYGTYDHLARVKEWSIGADEEDPGGSE